MSRQINDVGLSKIKSWEGLRLTAYNDGGGVWTIGYGHTSGVKYGQVIDEAQADAFLRADLAVFEDSVSSLVTVPLNDNQFSALVSFAFNVGIGAFKSSTLLRKLNSGDYSSVPTELMKWNKVNGKPWPGLTNRRAAEVGLWAKGNVVASQYVEPEPQKPKMSVVQKVSVAATSVGTASTMAAEQLNPISDYSPIIKAVCVGLIIVGVLAGLYTTLKQSKEQAT